MRSNNLKLPTFYNNIFDDEELCVMWLGSDNIVKLIDILENGIRKNHVPKYLRDESEYGELDILSDEIYEGIGVVIRIKDYFATDLITNSITSNFILGIVASPEFLNQDFTNYKINLLANGFEEAHKICSETIEYMRNSLNYEFDEEYLEELIISKVSTRLIEPDAQIAQRKIDIVKEFDKFLSGCIYEQLSLYMGKEDFTVKEAIEFFSATKLPFYNSDGVLINEVPSIQYKKRI